MLRRKFLHSLSGVLFSGLFIGSAALAETNSHNAQSAEFVEGVEYKLVPQPQSIAPYKKKVIEVFGYGCPHCYHLEPSLKNWLASKPADVEFERMPVVFNNPNWVFMARVYYTAQELGVLDKSHMAFFDAIHRDKKPLHNVADIAQLFTQFGVKATDFEATFKGFKVDQLMRRAQQLTRDYGVEGVPAIIVNGKYITDVPMAGSQAQLWKVVDQLTTQ